MNSPGDGGSEVNPESELELTVLGLPKTGTTWLGQLLAGAGVAGVFDESAKIEALWSRGGSVPILVAESVTDPLFLGGVTARKSALASMGSRLRHRRGLLVLREPEDWIGSLYRQYIKRGGTRRFRDFVGAAGQGVVDPAFVNYMQLVEEVREALGVPLAVSSFYRLEADPRGFLGDIAEAFGPDFLAPETVANIDEVLLSQRANVGLRGVSGHILRGINHVRRTRKWNPDGLFRWRSVEGWPWHLLAGVGRDIISEADVSWLRSILEPYNDWAVWEEAFSRQQILLYE